MAQWTKWSNSQLNSCMLCVFANKLPLPESSSILSRRSFSRTCVAANSFYDALGITKAATQQDIKKAYYKLSKVYHPDKNKGCLNSAEKFRLVSEAYEVLGNFRTRRLYDKGIGVFGKPIDSSAHDIVVPTEEDDAQTKFYKQHMRRTERPYVSGRATTYDFDEWASKCITESFERTQSTKRVQQEVEDNKQEQMESSNMSSVILVIVIGICLSSFILSAIGNTINSKKIDTKSHEMSKR